MYYYLLSGYEHNIVLQHVKRFSKEEFESMCKEVELLDLGYFKAYDLEKIQQHLIKKHGFNYLGYAAEFFTDGEAV
jgi:hypothetical protein